VAMHNSMSVMYRHLSNTKRIFVTTVVIVFVWK
jgi:hypothetical protein